jgi:hypothetical protein
VDLKKSPSSRIGHPREKQSSDLQQQQQQQQQQKQSSNE